MRLRLPPAHRGIRAALATACVVATVAPVVLFALSSGPELVWRACMAMAEQVRALW